MTRQQTSPATSDILSMEHLHHFTAGDEEVIRDVLTIFRDQASLWLQDLHADLDDRTWRMLAHSLKGSARGVGAFGMARLAEEAEALAASEAAGDAAEAGAPDADTQAARQAILTSLEDELTCVLKAINQALL